jgi:hypothetical protein
MHRTNYTNKEEKVCNCRYTRIKETKEARRKTKKILPPRTKKIDERGKRGNGRNQLLRGLLTTEGAENTETVHEVGMETRRGFAGRLDIMECK